MTLPAETGTFYGGENNGTFLSPHVASTEDERLVYCLTQQDKELNID